MAVTIRYPADHSLGVLLLTPQMRPRDEEELLVAEVLQRGQFRARMPLLVPFPGVVRDVQAADVGEVLLQRRSTVDVHGVAVGRDREVVVLVDEALCFLVEAGLRALVPPDVVAQPCPVQRGPCAYSHKAVGQLMGCDDSKAAVT